MQIKNDLVLRAARGEQVERTPVWLMRQAGRILKEYREVRNSLSGFKELVENPELAAEVTIQPVDILGVDAAIIFSDILVIPEAMGLSYEMVEKKGPYFPSTIQSGSDIKRVKIAEADDLRYTLDAIAITKKALDGSVPLIGFAGAPWTIFSYMVEGQGSKTFSKARRMLYQDPASSHELLEKITASTINYLKGQIAAGADMVQIFDSWAGVLPKSQYMEFSMRYIRQIAEAIDEVPITVFAKGAYFALEEMADLPCNTIGLDWNMSIEEAKKVLKGKTLQGNLDPCILYASQEIIEKEVKTMLSRFSGYPHIANLGHGVYPDTPPENVKFFVDAVKNIRLTNS